MTEQKQLTAGLSGRENPMETYTCPSCRIDHDDYTPDPDGEYARVCGICGWKHGKPDRPANERS